ncbi:hypothetical protein SOVF_059530 [Spinacia oleracea]|nr:hypothetical protein SOVF_059530 [Spinacia oleracea]
MSKNEAKKKRRLSQLEPSQDIASRQTRSRVNLKLNLLNLNYCRAIIL